MAQAAGLSSVRQPLVKVATECIRTLSLVLGDRTIAPAAGSRSADAGDRIPRQSAFDAGGFDTPTVDGGESDGRESDGGDFDPPAPDHSPSPESLPGNTARPNDGRSPNTTYDSGGATAPNDPAARRVLLQPHLVVRDSG